MNESHYTFKTKSGTKSGWYKEWSDVKAQYPEATLINQAS